MIRVFQVMTTETWSYFHSQLDRSRKIKMHILRDEKISFCGLHNQDDVGEQTWDEILKLENDVCKKCRQATYKTAFEANPPARPRAKALTRTGDG